MPIVHTSIAYTLVSVKVSLPAAAGCGPSSAAAGPSSAVAAGMGTASSAMSAATMMASSAVAGGQSMASSAGSATTATGQSQHLVGTKTGSRSDPKSVVLEFRPQLTRKFQNPPRQAPRMRHLQNQFRTPLRKSWVRLLAWSVQSQPPSLSYNNTSISIWIFKDT